MIGWLINRLSGYQRDRVFVREIYASESQRLVTDANGILDRDETIASASWQTDDTMTCYMSEPRIEGRSVAVRIRAQYAGRCRIRVTVRTDTGDEMSAWHVIRVLPAPYFGNEDWANGPSRLEVTA